MTINGVLWKDRKTCVCHEGERFGMGRKAGTWLGTVPRTKEKL